MKKLLIIILLFLIAAIAYSQDTEAQYLDNIESIDLLIERGISYEQRNMFNEAVETYRKILSIDKDNTLAGIRLAKLLGWQNRYDEALVILNRILEVFPELREALFRKAQILSWQKQYIESIETYKSYLELEKEEPEGLAGLARAYFWSGNHDEAVVNFNRSIAAGYYNEIEIRLDLAKIHLNMKDPVSAKAELDLIFEKDPENRDAQELLATLPYFMKYEASMAVRGDFFSGGDTGFKLSPSLRYRHNSDWEFNARYDLYVLDSKADNTVGAGAVYKGIDRLSLGADFAVTPSPVFSEAFKFSGLASYSINKTLGTGIAAEALIHTSNSNAWLEDKVLYILKPSLSYYFTDISRATLQYIGYILDSDFTASAVSMNIALEYYKKNYLTLAVTYGGDYSSQDSDRTIFEAGGSVFYRFSNNFEIGISYNHIEADFSKSNQFTLTPVIRW